MLAGIVSPPSRQPSPQKAENVDGTACFTPGIGQWLSFLRAQGDVLDATHQKTAAAPRIAPREGAGVSR